MIYLLELRACLPLFHIVFEQVFRLPLVQYIITWSIPVYAVAVDTVAAAVVDIDFSEPSASSAGEPVTTG